MSSLPAAARLQNALHAASVETDLAYVDRHVIATDRLLGCGGFGAVYAGYRRDDAGVWRDAAIKMLMVPMPRQLESVVGVAQQAGLESRLSLCVRGGHTVCTGRAFAKLSLDCVCVPLERCEETLADLLRRKPMGGLSVPTPIVCSIFFQCMTALVALAASDIVHCDIKPENILLMWDDGRDSGVPRVRLGDLGLGVTGTTVRYSTAPLCRGTPGYIAPEGFIGGDQATPYARDVWSMGCTLHQLVMGTFAVDGGAWELLQQCGVWGVPARSLVAPEALLVDERRALYGVICGMLVPWARYRMTALQALCAIPRHLWETTSPALVRPPRQYARMVVPSRCSPLRVYAAPPAACGDGSPAGSFVVLTPERNDVMVAADADVASESYDPQLWHRVVYPRTGYCRALRTNGGATLCPHTHTVAASDEDDVATFISVRRALWADAGPGAAEGSETDEDSDGAGDFDFDTDGSSVEEDDADCLPSVERCLSGSFERAALAP